MRKLFGLTFWAAAAAAALLLMAAMLPIGEARGEGHRDVAPNVLAGGSDQITSAEGWGGLTGGSDQTPIGHEQGKERFFSPRGACDSLDAVVQLISLSSVSTAALNEFWAAMLLAGTCKEFPMGLRFWPDVVVTELKWGDGDPMWIIQGHDSSNDGRKLYIWMPISRARERHIPPPGLSSI